MRYQNRRIMTDIQQLFDVRSVPSSVHTLFAMHDTVSKLGKSKSRLSDLIDESLLIVSYHHCIGSEILPLEPLSATRNKEDSIPGFKRTVQSITSRLDYVEHMHLDHSPQSKTNISDNKCFHVINSTTSYQSHFCHGRSPPQREEQQRISSSLQQ